MLRPSVTHGSRAALPLPASTGRGADPPPSASPFLSPSRLPLPPAPAPPLPRAALFSTRRPVRPRSGGVLPSSPGGSRHEAAARRRCRHSLSLSHDMAPHRPAPTAAASSRCARPSTPAVGAPRHGNTWRGAGEVSARARVPAAWTQLAAWPPWARAAPAAAPASARVLGATAPCTPRPPGVAGPAGAATTAHRRRRHARAHRTCHHCPRWTAAPMPTRWPAASGTLRGSSTGGGPPARAGVAGLARAGVDEVIARAMPGRGRPPLGPIATRSASRPPRSGRAQRSELRLPPSLSLSLCRQNGRDDDDAVCRLLSRA